MLNIVNFIFCKRCINCNEFVTDTNFICNECFKYISLNKFPGICNICKKVSRTCICRQSVIIKFLFKNTYFIEKLLCDYCIRLHKHRILAEIIHKKTPKDFPATIISLSKKYDMVCEEYNTINSKNNKIKCAIVCKNEVNDMQYQDISSDISIIYVI